MTYVKNGSHLERTARKAFDDFRNSHNPIDYFELCTVRLNFCKAKIIVSSEKRVFLKSYDTIVAVLLYDHDKNPLVIANGTYSRTTVQHIYKFAKKYSAPVLYLKPQLKAV